MVTRKLPAAARKQTPARRYRYRTKTLMGPWRSTRQEAIDDALRARQARLSDADAATVHWIIDGFIEESGRRSSHQERAGFSGGD